MLRCCKFSCTSLHASCNAASRSFAHPYIRHAKLFTIWASSLLPLLWRTENEMSEKKSGPCCRFGTNDVKMDVRNFEKKRWRLHMKLSKLSKTIFFWDERHSHKQTYWNVDSRKTLTGWLWKVKSKYINYDDLTVRSHWTDSAMA